MKRLCAALFTAATLGLGFTTAAQAHQIWFEPTPQGTRLYFGEYGDNLREVSPGLLDKFVKPRAFKVAGADAAPVALTKAAASFELAANVAKPGESLVAEDTSYPISERKDGDKLVRSLYHPAARLVTDGSAQQPRLKLDLTPTGQADDRGMQLRATYNGAALAKAKVAVVTASGWAQELRSADDGTLRVALPWHGIYVLELSHTDATGGERDGQRYDRASHVTSLTLVRATGLEPLPPAPAAKPNTLN